jgi:hypothetical protein
MQLSHFYRLCKELQLPCGNKDFFDLVQHKTFRLDNPAAGLGNLKGDLIKGFSLRPILHHFRQGFNGADQDEMSCQIGTVGTDQSRRPSALTVTDQGWPVRIRVAKDDLLDKARFRIFNAGKRLTRFRLGEKRMK